MPILFPEADFQTKRPITYSEFLDTVKVLKMLYGRDIAERFFTQNKHLWYNQTSASVCNS